MNYAIIIKTTKEFYPDPIYTDLKRIRDKIAYLKDYRIKNNMELREYEIEKLSKKRKEQHDKEWKQFCSAID